jgi:hypothetical protein
MAGVLNHEIGTHLVRRLNDNKQIWYNQRSRYGLQPYLATEEGLASINSVLDQANDPDRKPYLW